MLTFHGVATVTWLRDCTTGGRVHNHQVKPGWKLRDGGRGWPIGGAGGGEAGGMSAGEDIRRGGVREEVSRSKERGRRKKYHEVDGMEWIHVAGRTGQVKGL